MQSFLRLFSLSVARKKTSSSLFIARSDSLALDDRQTFIKSAPRVWILPLGAGRASAKLALSTVARPIRINTWSTTKSRVRQPRPRDPRSGRTGSSAESRTSARPLRFHLTAVQVTDRAKTQNSEDVWSVDEEGNGWLSRPLIQPRASVILRTSQQPVIPASANACRGELCGTQALHERLSAEAGGLRSGLRQEPGVGPLLYAVRHNRKRQRFL